MNIRMNFNPDIENLIYGHLRGRLSSEEQAKLDKWLNDKPANKVLFDRICDKETILRKAKFFDRHSQEKMWESLESKIYKKKKRYFLHRWIAASLMVPLFVGAWLLMNNGERDGKKEVGYEILSGTACARLELADGTVIALHQDSVYSVELARGERLDNEGGMVSYAQDSTGEVVKEYNEIRTPRGGEYQIRLPDGTKVWLNAESVLRFPRMFSGNERHVYAQGELYFEVARDSTRPFRVELESYTVEVTGTEFNVRTYADGPQLTTLVSGGVTIYRENEIVCLKPGEEAVLQQAGGTIHVQKAEVESRLAWLRGYFLFDNAKLEDIMNELGRWYNVDIFFENTKVREERFSLELRRHEDFWQVLDLIERAGMVEIVVKKNVIFIK